MVFPPQGFSKSANLQKEGYDNLMAKAKNSPESFWSDLAKKELKWFEDFTEVLDQRNEPFYKWFKNGKTNISYNCIDRHLSINGGNLDEKAALIFEDEEANNKTLNYKELYEQVCKTANMLKELGIQKGDIVCIYMPLCIESIVAMQACTRIGAVHSVIFAGFSSQALKDRIIDGKAKLVITANGFYRRGKVVNLISAVAEAIEGLDFVDNTLCLERISNKEFEINYPDKAQIKNLKNWKELFDKQKPECPPEKLEASDPSFILYTSGSTGKPKGIQHSTAGYLLWTHLTSKWIFDLKENDIYWCTADIGWITGHSYVTYGPLSNGATCFIYEGAPNHPNNNRFWEIIEKHKISIFYTAPTAIRAFRQWDQEPKQNTLEKRIADYDLSSLRLLGSVGEPINPDVWTWYYEQIGKSKCPIVDTWWQTETGGIMISTLPGIHEMKPGSAGLALPGIDAEVNEEGLLTIKSPWASMLQTIYGNEERYLKAYWQKQNNTWSYIPGDGANLDQDEYITITGRVDDVINISGHRLGTAEVESALVSHPQVSEAAVVPIPHEIKGQGIVAYTVIKKELEEKNEQEWKELAEKLKGHISKEIGAIAKPEEIIICGALPKTRSGKIMRRLLKDLAQGKKPQGDMSTIENESVIQDLQKQLQKS